MSAAEPPGLDDAPPVERLFKVSPGALQARPHRAYREVEQLGRVAEAQLIDIAEQDDFAVLLGERLENRVELLARISSPLLVTFAPLRGRIRGSNAGSVESCSCRFLLSITCARAVR